MIERSRYLPSNSKMRQSRVPASGDDFAQVHAADAQTLVDAGRAYVAAYVKYTHYIEGIHEALMPQDKHGGKQVEDAH